MKQKIFILPLALFMFVSNCSKDKDKDDDKQLTGFNDSCTPVTYSGLDISIDGDISSEIDPQSTQFADYLTCIQNCSESNPDDPDCLMNCLGLLGVVPAGGAFSLTVQITNTTGSEITYVLEPGDWFEPGTSDYQPMMTPVNISEVIDAGETVTLVIPVYCLASEKSAPDDESEYTMCDMVSSGSCLSEIVAILETKDVSSFSFAQSFQVQQIIWNCTEGNEIDWDYLNSLP